MINFRAALKEAINAERGARGWSMQQLAAASGVPYGTLRNYLDHDRDMPATVIAAVAGAFDMLPSTLAIEAERRMERPEVER